MSTEPPRIGLRTEREPPGTRVRSVLSPQSSVLRIDGVEAEPAARSIGFYGRAWRKLLRDPISMAAAIGLGIVVVVTLVGPIVA